MKLAPDIRLLLEDAADKIACALAYNCELEPQAALCNLLEQITDLLELPPAPLSEPESHGARRTG